MAKQLLGKEVVAALNERIIAKAEALKANGVTPTLGIVRVGENESDLSYERGATKRCEKLGVEYKKYLLPADATQVKKAVVVGRSLVVGKPAAMMLIKKNATVTVCHTRTVDMPSVVKEADIVIVAAGRAGVVDDSYVRAGQVIIDVGINVNAEGKLCGDVAYDKVEPIVDAITPVPGGVGSVTTSVLIGHVVDAAEKAAARR